MKMVSRWHPYQLLFSLLILCRVAVEISARTLHNGGSEYCFSTQRVDHVNIEGVTIAVLPVKDVVSCLQTLEMSSTNAIGAVKGYRDLFKAGYAYYNYNNNPLNSTPFANPYHWGVYNGTSGGQVDFELEFGALINQIQKDGKSDGLLPYEIEDIINRSRDFHTSTIGNPINVLLFKHGNNPSGTASRWLSLDTDESGRVFVAGFPTFQDSNSALMAERKNGVRVKAINSADPLKFLDDFVQNPAIGGAHALDLLAETCSFDISRINHVATILPEMRGFACDLELVCLHPQILFSDKCAAFLVAACSLFRSPGSRMTCFLNQMEVTIGSLRWASIGNLGDITTLPDSLHIEYANGESETWHSFVNVVQEYLTMSRADLNVILNSPPTSVDGMSPYVYFKNILDGNPPAPARSSPATAAPSAEPLQPDSKAARDITVTPNNQIGWLEFQTLNTSAGELFSGYAVVNDTMIWKIQTFAEAKLNHTAFVNFWNAMVEESEEKNITKLLIDVSGNTGGSVGVSTNHLQLLYPEASFSELVPKFNSRISEIMLTMGNEVFPAFYSIISNLSNAQNLKAVEVITRSQTFLGGLRSVLGNGAGLTKGYKPEERYGFGAAWITLNATNFEKLLTSVGVSDVSVNTEQSPHIVDLVALQESVALPALCNSNQAEPCAVSTRIEGGVKTYVSQIAPLIQVQDYQDEYDFIQQNAKRGPFAEYILLSDGNAGSATDLLQSGMRYLSNKYTGSAPNLVTVGYAGNGNKADQALTQFSGSVSRSGSILEDIYGLFTTFKALDFILRQLQMAGLTKQVQGVSKQDIEEYHAAVEKMQLQLPQPPFFSTELPQYTWASIYSQRITDETLPEEFWIITPDMYVSFWPIPKSTSLSRTASKSLGLLYRTVLQYKA